MAEYVLWAGKFARAVVTDRSPMEHAYNIVIQMKDGDGWRDLSGGFNSLSDDYAYTNAREAAQRQERQCERPEAII